MMLWITLALLTVAAALSILVPMARTARAATSAGADGSADEAVYKAQLDEVDRDLARGLMNEEAAEAAKAEIARRLIAARRKSVAGAAGTPSAVRTRAVQAIALLGVPAGALGCYLLLGSPDLVDQPLAARLEAPAENQRVDMLVARVERHLADNPEDGQGWQVLAPVYFRMGRPMDAARAYANAIRLLGASEDLESSFGEALVVANDGIVTADARAAFERAVALSPAAIKPRFFLALALGQEGRRDEAVAAWNTLLAGADPSAPWVGAAQAELAGLGAEVPEMKGPTREQMAAAQDMSADDRNAMILGMVEGLQARLDDEGGSVTEWLRLINAYAVLGKVEEARAAVTSARKAYEGDQSALGTINEAAKAAGLDT